MLDASLMVAFADDDDEKRKLIIIVPYSDINLPAWPGQGDQTGATTLCVGSYTRSYSLVARGTTTDSEGRQTFALRGPNDALLPIWVFWSDEPQGPNKKTVLLPNQMIFNQKTQALPKDCSGAFHNTALLTAHIHENALAAAPAGRYVGTISLTVRPE